MENLTCEEKKKTVVVPPVNPTPAGSPIPGDPQQPAVPTPVPLPEEDGKDGERSIDLALLFGTSEEELEREFKDFKAKKLFSKFDYDLIRTCDENEFEDKLKGAVEHCFGSVVVTPRRVAKAKRRLKGSGVKVVAAICFPYGEELLGVKKLSAKLAVKKGADALFVPCGMSQIKDDKTDVIKSEFKKICKISKKIPVFAAIECGDLERHEIERTASALSSVGVKGFLTSCGDRFEETVFQSVKDVRNGARAGAVVECYTEAETGDGIAGLLAGADRLFVKNAESVALDFRKKFAY